jgi:hypothetical protein
VLPDSAARGVCEFGMGEGQHTSGSCMRSAKDHALSCTCARTALAVDPQLFVLQPLLLHASTNRQANSLTAIGN